MADVTDEQVAAKPLTQEDIDRAMQRGRNAVFRIGGTEPEVLYAEIGFLREEISAQQAQITQLREAVTRARD